MAVMREQLNGESRVELKDASIAPNVNDWNHGTGNAETHEPIEPPCTERYARWCERTVAQIMGGLLLNFIWTDLG